MSGGRGELAFPARSEDFLATIHGRDMVQEIELAPASRAEPGRREPDQADGPRDPFPLEQGQRASIELEPVLRRLARGAARVRLKGLEAELQRHA